MKIDLENVWQRICMNERQIFIQIRGAEFSYLVVRNSIRLDRTNRQISKTQFEKALKLVPLKNTVPLQSLQAPSYIYAIIMDKRIRHEDW